ncbi:MAG: hypothetical protein LBH01_03900 [Verrucomicrobiales bacterium]|nr:hypothetical protein [Verrucomicrobiales bacterium]
MKPKNKYDSSPIPIRLENRQDELLKQYRDKTGLSQSFIIRRCIDYGLERFVKDQVDILTLKEK